MKQRNGNPRWLMVMPYLFGVLFLAGATLFIVGCSRTTSTAAPQAAVIAAVQQPAVQPTATAVSEADEMVPEVIEPVDNCLECHVNQELLIEVADPEEEVVVENEGEG